ncbi:MAG: DUF2085 domain-containing protein [Candidatus Aminicenantes bacterium]|nr:DUF2085 domain-containing protein [Candidatus Aminicenantes bacterium]
MNLRQRLSWLLTILVSGLILGGVFLAPLTSWRWPLLSKFVYLLYSPLCHQQPERSYFLNGHQLAVCSRCLGIYSGFFLSSLIYPTWRRSFRLWITSRPLLIILMATPMGVDVFFNLIKLWSSPLILRTIVGFVWSAVLPFFWFKALDELSARSERNN